MRRTSSPFCAIRRIRSAGEGRGRTARSPLKAKANSAPAARAAAFAGTCGDAANVIFAIEATGIRPIRSQKKPARADCARRLLEFLKANAEEKPRCLA